MIAENRKKWYDKSDFDKKSAEKGGERGSSMEMKSIQKELSSNSYPGRGIIIGKSPNGKYAVTAYFIMGRSENSRNRVFVTEGEGIRTEAFDPSKLSDPSLIIYAPVRVLGNKTIVTNGDQTDTIYELMDKQQSSGIWLCMKIVSFSGSSPQAR